MLPLDGYVRVSRVGDRSGESFISPDVQEKAIRAWAKANGVEVVLQPHELNVSGGTMDRPVFNSIMERIAGGESGGFVVYKLDRFARTLLGAITTIEEIGRHHAAFASVTEPQLDYTTPAGRAFVQQMFVFAEFVRSTLKESWAISQRSAIERGIHISPTKYLGYDKADDGRLVPNGEAEIAREFFLRRADGESWGLLTDWLNTVARKDTLWAPTTVMRLSGKRVYRGEASRYVGQDVDGRGAVVNPDAHPAIVSEDEWQAAQQRPRLTKVVDRERPLLSELIRCSGCRFTMSAGVSKGDLVLYRCRPQKASGTCQNPANVAAHIIEPFVEAAVLDAIEGVVKFVPTSEDRDAASRVLKSARDDLADFRRDTAAKRKLGAQWHEFLDEYIRAVSAAETEVARIDAAVGVGRQGLTREHYLALSRSDRREVLAGFVDAVMVRRSQGRGRNVDPVEQRVRILWRGEAPPDLPRQRVVSPVVPFNFEDDVEPGVAAT